MSHSRGACVALARYLCSSAYERMPDRSSCLWKLLAASPAHAASFLVVAVARYLYARGGLQLPIQPVPSLEAMVDALLADDGKAAAPSSPPQTPADEPASFMLLLRGIFYVATMVQFDSSSQPLRAVFNRWTNFLATRRKSAAASATATTTAPDLELEGRILRKISVVESHSALASAALTAATNDDDAVRHDLALTVLVDRLESGVVAPSVAFDALLTEFQRLAPRPGAPLTNPRGAVHRRPSLRQSQRLLLLARRLLRSSPHVPPEMLPRFQQAVAPLCMLPVPVGSLARSLLEALQQEVRCPGSLQRLNQTQQQQRIHVVVDLDSGTAAVEAARKLGATQLSTAADQVHVVLSHSADNEDVRLHRLRRAVADRFKAFFGLDAEVNNIVTNAVLAASPAVLKSAADELEGVCSFVQDLDEAQALEQQHQLYETILARLQAEAMMEPEDATVLDVPDSPEFECFAFNSTDAAGYGIADITLAHEEESHRGSYLVHRDMLARLRQWIQPHHEKAAFNATAAPPAAHIIVIGGDAAVSAVCGAWRVVCGESRVLLADSDPVAFHHVALDPMATDGDDVDGASSDTSAASGRRWGRSRPKIKPRLSRPSLVPLEVVAGSDSAMSTAAAPEATPMSPSAASPPPRSSPQNLPLAAQPVRPPRPAASSTSGGDGNIDGSASIRQRSYSSSAVVRRPSLTNTNPFLSGGQPEEASVRVVMDGQNKNAFRVTFSRGDQLSEEEEEGEEEEENNEETTGAVAGTSGHSNNTNSPWPDGLPQTSSSRPSSLPPVLAEGAAVRAASVPARAQRTGSLTGASRVSPVSSSRPSRPASEADLVESAVAVMSLSSTNPFKADFVARSQRTSSTASHADSPEVLAEGGGEVFSDAARLAPASTTQAELRPLSTVDAQLNLSSRDLQLFRWLCAADGWYRRECGRALDYVLAGHMLPTLCASVLGSSTAAEGSSDCDALEADVARVMSRPPAHVAPAHILRRSLRMLCTDSARPQPLLMYDVTLTIARRNPTNDPPVTVTTPLWRKLVVESPPPPRTMAALSLDVVEQDALGKLQILHNQAAQAYSVLSLERRVLSEANADSSMPRQPSTNSALQCRMEAAELVLTMCRNLPGERPSSMLVHSCNLEAADPLHPMAVVVDGVRFSHVSRVQLVASQALQPLDQCHVAAQLQPLVLPLRTFL